MKIVDFALISFYLFSSQHQNKRTVTDLRLEYWRSQNYASKVGQIVRLRIRFFIMIRSFLHLTDVAKLPEGCGAQNVRNSKISDAELYAFGFAQSPSGQLKPLVSHTVTHYFLNFGSSE